MDIYPYSGGPETQTILSVRDSITNLISFVAEYSDSTDQITFKRLDSGGSMDAVATPNLTLTKGISFWICKSALSHSCFEK